MYTSGKLYVGILVTGTPTWGMACSITVTPINYSLKSGETGKILGVSELGKNLLIDVTPSTGALMCFCIQEKLKSEKILYCFCSYAGGWNVFFCMWEQENWWSRYKNREYRNN